MIKDIMVIGAGAIGRGYLPWVFENVPVRFHFVDANKDLVQSLNQAGSYSTFLGKSSYTRSISVDVAGAYHISDPKVHGLKVDLIVLCVGPRNTLEAFKNVKAFDCPVIIAENDNSIVDTIRFQHQKNNVYFAIPDVIASNTAPSKLLYYDCLSVVTEDGEFFVDESSGLAIGRIKLLNEENMHKQWNAKMYLHNTAHCIVSYLGYLNDNEFIHEAMNNEFISNVALGVIREMQFALQSEFGYTAKFVGEYGKKEFRRFSNTLLFDPIARVARDPLRKLQKNERIFGAIKTCIRTNILPENLCVGLAAAILYDGDDGSSDGQLRRIRERILNTQNTGSLMELIGCDEYYYLKESLDNSLFYNIRSLNETFRVGLTHRYQT